MLNIHTGSMWIDRVVDGDGGGPRVAELLDAAADRPPHSLAPPVLGLGVEALAEGHEAREDVRLPVYLVVENLGLAGLVLRARGRPELVWGEVRVRGGGEEEVCVGCGGGVEGRHCSSCEGSGKETAAVEKHALSALNIGKVAV